MRYLIVVGAFATLLFSPMLLADSVTLTPQAVIDRMLAEGLERQEIEWNRKITSLEYYLAKGEFDFGMETELNYQSVEIEPLGPFENDKEETYNFSTIVKKPFKYGSDVSLKYARQSIQRELNPFLESANSLPTTTIDYVTLEVQQSLLNNFMGGVKARSLKIQELLEENRDEKMLEDLEDLVVKGLQHFWQAYSAQERLRSALDARDRYKRLVATAKRKQRLGFTAPGELARVQAEFEQKDQSVKSFSREYLRKIDELFQLLVTPAPEEVIFDVGKDIPPLPLMNPVNLENLRTIKTAERQVEANEINKKRVESSQLPELNLVGKLSYRGADERASEAFSDLGGLNSPTYYMGFIFRTYLGSESERGRTQEANSKLALSRLSHERAKMQQRDSIRDAERAVRTFYQIALSSLRTVELRKTALRQIEGAYGQGRLDVSEVIDAFNLLLTSETQTADSVGNYRIGRNELADLRDELVTTYIKDSLKSTSGTNEDKQ